MQIVDEGKNGSVIVQSPSSGRIFNRTTGQTYTPKKEEPVYQPQVTQPAASSVSNNISNLYADRINASRSAALNALAQKLNLNLNMYQNELDNVDKNYEKLIDESEVERYKTRKALRETLANRGQLNSGVAAQQALDLDTKYGNNVINIKNQAEQDRQTIRNAMASLKADYQNDLAQLENSYASALAQLA